MMKKLINRSVQSADVRAMMPQFSRMHLTRTFVETGDERCPIAGIWSRLESDAAADDSELTRPAAWRLLRWRAFFFRPGIFTQARQRRRTVEPF
jgi:hypothetical protein